MTIALVVGGPDPEAVMEDTWGALAPDTGVKYL